MITRRRVLKTLVLGSGAVALSRPAFSADAPLAVVRARSPKVNKGSLFMRAPAR